MKLLQLPGDSNPETLRKIKPIRDHHLAELTLIHEQLKKPILKSCKT